MAKQIFSILLVAATYIGTIVGAGFATGKEIVTFFSVHGTFGAIGIVITGFLFIFVGTKIMIISARIGAYSYQDLNVYLFGSKGGKFVNIFMFIVVICVTSVMLSGAGAVFHEQLGLSFQFGIIITIILCYIVVLKGMRGIFAINSYIVPLMILFSLFVFISIFSGKTDGLVGQVMAILHSESWEWIISPLTYSSFNLMTALVVLVPLGNEIRDERILKWGGFLGGFGLFLILIMSHFSLSAFPATFSYDIPMAEIVKLFGTVLHVFFLLVIFGEIFNTVVGNVFGITRQLKAAFGLRYQHAVLLILFVIFVISQAGYGKLLTVLYPLFGYLGLFMLFLLIVKRMPEK
ncbi:hypothetical protein [Oceanobacillus profundus]|uniref:YkvI family membrane protein n=1 Tax=Oceanobacillus TaxID=182709 RepID=UPI0026E1C349|nr:hypothetical protein [Oceanobacillus profundus]MBR3120046.1 hypothetical protein [Oceanobacillus sp.]MDO6451660.1 hypothetical protein [Oceanobacillus profundus]